VTKNLKTATVGPLKAENKTHLRVNDQMNAT